MAGGRVRVCVFGGALATRSGNWAAAVRIESVSKRLRTSGLLAHVVQFGYDSRAMLSRAQEARVREILGSHTPGTLPAYCLEHLATTAQIPPAHVADLAAFVWSLRAYGACQTRYGGTCDADGHVTARLLIWGPPSPMTAGGSHAREGTLRVP